MRNGHKICEEQRVKQYRNDKQALIQMNTVYLMIRQVVFNIFVQYVISKIQIMYYFTQLIVEKKIFEDYFPFADAAGLEPKVSIQILFKNVSKYFVIYQKSKLDL